MYNPISGKKVEIGRSRAVIAGVCTVIVFLVAGNVYQWLSSRPAVMQAPVTPAMQAPVQQAPLRRVPRYQIITSGDECTRQGGSWEQGFCSAAWTETPECSRQRMVNWKGMCVTCDDVMAGAVWVSEFGRCFPPAK